MGINLADFIKTFIRPAAVFSTAACLCLASCGGGGTSGTDARPQGAAKSKKGQAAPVEEEPMDVSRLTNMRINLLGLNIPCGIGESEAGSEAEALAAATEKAREELSKSAGVQIFRFAETYAIKVGADARNKWEESANRQTDTYVRSSPVFKSAARRNRETGRYEACVLVMLDPVNFKQALKDAAANNDAFKKKAQKELLMKKMDAVIEDFNNKYRR